MGIFNFWKRKPDPTSQEGGSQRPIEDLENTRLSVTQRQDPWDVKVAAEPPDPEAAKKYQQEVFANKIGEAKTQQPVPSEGTPPVA